MSAQELEKRKGCNRRVVIFFVFAVLCVAAFLIVGLVKTCNAEHEEKVDETIEQQELGMSVQSEDLQLFA